MSRRMLKLLLEIIVMTLIQIERTIIMIGNETCDNAAHFDDICNDVDDTDGCDRNGTPRYLGLPSAHAARQR